MAGHVEKGKVGRKKPVLQQTTPSACEWIANLSGVLEDSEEEGFGVRSQGIRLCWQCIVEMDKEESQWVQRFDIRIVGETL